jgi:hypothetical protein
MAMMRVGVAELKDQLSKYLRAVEAGDEVELDKTLDELAELVRSRGEPLADDEIATSDALIPPSDMTLEETRQFLSEEGFVPDLPAPS